MGASNLTLTESLDGLRGRWPFVSDVLSGQYAVWLEGVTQLTTIRPRNLLDKPPAHWSSDRGEFVAEHRFLALLIAEGIQVTDPANDDATNTERLTADAALPLRGEPLLGTLYLLTLLLKAREFANRGGQDLGKTWCDFIEQARKSWQSFLQQRYDAAADPNDSHRAWRQLADELPNVVTRFVTIYRNLTTLSSPTAYRALDNRHLGLLKSESNVPELNYHWLMLVLAVLKEGWTRNLWRLGLALGQETRHGQFVLSLSGRDLSVFIVRDGASSLSRMIQDQIVDMRHASNVIVIYPADREPARRDMAAHSHARTRRSLSAHRFPNRTPRSGPLEIWMRDRVDAHAQPTTLLHALQQEMQSS